MTSEPIASTSSDKTVQLKPWEATVTLGNRITAELDLESRGDTLGRWMAHRIAELMREAKTGGAVGDVAKAACTELIFKLWQQREQMGRSRPLGEIISALDQMTTHRHHRQSPIKGKKATWISTLSDIRHLHERETEIWRNAALLEINPKQARAWLDSGKENLSEQEIQLAESVVNLHDRLASGALFIEAKTLDKDDPVKRSTMIIEILRSLTREREKLLRQVIGPAKKRAKTKRKKT